MQNGKPVPYLLLYLIDKSPDALKADFMFLSDFKKRVI